MVVRHLPQPAPERRQAHQQPGKLPREVAQRTVFTTHTPVPAGHDRFDGSLIEEHLGPLRDELGVEPEEETRALYTRIRDGELVVAAGEEEGLEPPAPGEAPYVGL